MKIGETIANFFVGKHFMQVEIMDRQEYLLEEQARRCNKLEQLQYEYNATNLLMESIHKRIEELQKEDELLNDQMNNIRIQINLNERKVCKINKALRDKNPPEVFNPKDWEGDVSNI